MEMKELVTKYRDYVRDIRREFHQCPELSMQEVETTTRIAKKLDEMGIPYEIDTEKNTGLVGIIQGAHEGKAVALRADIDALPVTEATGLPFASKNVGKMHACGHDNHMAMLLGAAKMLLDMKDEIYGTVYLVFQPAEETGEGAPYMMRFGDWFSKVGAIFGGHIWADSPAGTISARSGAFMAATDKFTIKIHGKQSHGSQPQAGIDAVVVGSAIVMNLQTLVSRQFGAVDPVVVTVGTFKGGDRWNIVGGEAYLDGTTRYFDKKIGKELKEKMERIVKSTAEAYGATAELEYTYIVPPTVNDAACTAIVKQAVTEVLGSDALYDHDLVMGGEDFSFYQDKKPGSFMLVGTYNPECNAVYPNHSNYFTSDESILSCGSGVYAQTAIDWLKANK